MAAKTQISWNSSLTPHSLLTTVTHEMQKAASIFSCLVTNLAAANISLLQQFEVAHYLDH